MLRMSKNDLSYGDIAAHQEGCYCWHSLGQTIGRRPVTKRCAVQLNLAQVRPRSVGDEGAARLERLIVAGDLQPGDRLPSERDLALTLNVSRASLREAMHELEAKRLIERRPGRGTTVLPAPDRVTR